MSRPVEPARTRTLPPGPQPPAGPAPAFGRGRQRQRPSGRPCPPAPPAGPSVLGRAGGVRLRALGPHPLDLLKSRAQLGDPVRLVAADQANAPRQGLAAAPSHPGIDEGVEHAALAHAQPGHHRHAGGGELLGRGAAARSPGDLAPEASLGVLGDADPLLAGVLSEPFDPGGFGDLAAFGRQVAPQVGFGQAADDQDLVVVEGDLGRSGEPPVGQLSGEPAEQSGPLVGARCVRLHAYMITQCREKVQHCPQGRPPAWR